MRSGWAYRALGDVCDIIGGGTPAKDKEQFYQNGTVPWATVRDMKSDIIDDTEFKITHEAIKSSSTNIIPEGNIIIATRVGLGKACLLAKDTAINQDLKGVIPKKHSKLLVGYLFQWFKNNAQTIQAQGTGATVQGVKLPFIRSLILPIPPIEEQQRIVAILDQAFDGIATAKANAEKNLKNAREIFESHLNAVFTQGGKGWLEKTIGELAEHCLGKMLDKQKNKGEFKPYLRNLNVRWFDFDLTDLLQMKFEESEKDRYSALKGDVLVCEGGYPGRAAIWAHNEPIYFQKAIHRVRFKEKLHNRWFQYFLFLSDINGNLSRYFTGSGIQHFTGQALRRFVLPIAPSSEMEHHLKKFEELRDETQRLEAIYQRKLTALDELKKSLLHQAFTGELTTSPDKQLDEALT